MAKHIIRTPPPSVDELIQKTPLKGAKDLGGKPLRDILKGRGRVVKFPPGKDSKPPFVVLSPRQPWHAERGEIRFFSPDFIHPDWNVAVFYDEQIEACAFIYLHGLTKGKDYIAKLRVKGFPVDGINGPTPNEPGHFDIRANGDEILVKPTFKEQTITLTFLDSTTTGALIFLRGEKLFAWHFYEISVVEADI